MNQSAATSHYHELELKILENPFNLILCSRLHNESVTSESVPVGRWQKLEIELTVRIDSQLSKINTCQ
jgi:hypothetical protein